MSTSIYTPELQAALEQIEAEWKAFQVAHKMQPKPQRPIAMPQSHGTSYSQSRLWSQADHIAESHRLNEIDRLKG